MRRRLAAVPRAAWVCALFAMAHGAVWGIVQPPLQGPDEPIHAAYVEYVARTGKLPTGAAPTTPVPGDRQLGSLPRPIGTLFRRIGWSVEGPPVWSPGQEQTFRQQLATLPFDSGNGDTYVRSNPPLYYGLQVALLKATGVQDVRNRLLVMRLGSAVIAAFTAFFLVLFLRELLPGRPWTWSVGGLAVAAQPLFGFVAGSINPDNLLAACSAALLWLIARGFRRGLSPGLAAGIGAAALAGMLSKTAMAGLLPGAALACLVMASRQLGGLTELPRPARIRRAIVPLIAGTVVFFGGFGAWLALNQIAFDRAPSGTASGFTASSVEKAATIPGQIAYLGKFYIHRSLPLGDDFPRLRGSGLWQTWVQGFIGRFGWFQFGFPLWVNIAGTIVLAAVVGLAVRASFLHRRAFRRRRGELGCYALMSLGLLLLVGVAAYRFKVTTTSNFEQTRYLLPLLGLWGGVVALALHAFDDRRGRLVGGAIGGLLIAHALAAQLLTIGRYYG